jgi:hypothetical protein
MRKILSVTEWPGEKTLDLVGTAIAYRPFVEVARRRERRLLVSDVLYHLGRRALHCLPGLPAGLTNRFKPFFGEAKAATGRVLELGTLGCPGLASGFARCLLPGFGA